MSSTIFLNPLQSKDLEKSLTSVQLARNAPIRGMNCHKMLTLVLIRHTLGTISLPISKGDFDGVRTIAVRPRKPFTKGDRRDQERDC